MLGIDASFQWYTVHNGSWEYRDKLIAPFRERIQTGNKVLRIERKDDKVIVHTLRGEAREYDRIVIATHADQALRLLGQPTKLERELLQPFQYQPNVAKLHFDESVMPKSKSTWSAWNYRVHEVNGQLSATTIYWMNKLQGLDAKKNYFVSINDPGLIDESKVVRTIQYDHPIFTPQTETAQQRLHQLNAHGRTWFCGSYFKYGFHEDALTSALHASESLLAALKISAVRNPEMVISS
jgi:predicted NAD/FAD-binding protein